MNLLVGTAPENTFDSFWPEIDTYRWMSTLSSLGWAWEFLRRNPAYMCAYNSEGGRTSGVGADDTNQAPFWGLLRFENPAVDARHANVFWQLEDCREVLPLAASPMRRGTEAITLDLRNLQCRTTVHPFGADQRQDLLFAQDGRFLQLAVFGDTPLEQALLLTPALPSSIYRGSRLLAMRRLTDLVKHGWMRPSLYRRERRAPRLMRVTQALDGWLAEASYRDIGIALYGPARVERDWQDPRDHLRDHVRRAVRYGRDLMAGGYRQFLR